MKQHAAWKATGEDCREAARTSSARKRGARWKAQVRNISIGMHGFYMPSTFTSIEEGAAKFSFISIPFSCFRREHHRQLSAALSALSALGSQQNSLKSYQIRIRILSEGFQNLFSRFLTWTTSNITVNFFFSSFAWQYLILYVQEGAWRPWTQVTQSYRAGKTLRHRRRSWFRSCWYRT